MRLIAGAAILRLVLGTAAIAVGSSDTTSQKPPAVQSTPAPKQAMSKPLRVTPAPQPTKWAKIKELFL
jgi:hypothetical protein